MFLVIAATTFVAYWMLMPDELDQFGRSVVSIVLFSSNFYFWQQTGYFDAWAQTTPLLHTWSLAVEEQFYLLFPAVLIVVSRLKRLHPVGIVIMIAWSPFRSAHGGCMRIRVPPITCFHRARELMLGAALALLRQSRGDVLRSTPITDVLLSIGLCLIVGPVFLYDAFTPFPGFAAPRPVHWYGARYLVR